MANELGFVFSSTLVHGSCKDSTPTETHQVSQSATGLQCRTVSVTTSEGDIAFADISTFGYAYLRNLDATNFITYGPKSSGSMVAFGKLKPGEAAWVRLFPGITLRAIADTGTCKLFVKVMED